MRTQQYTQQQVVDALCLVPHPEGGFFRETYRSGAEPMASRGLTDAAGTTIPTDRTPPERNTMTSIYYLVSGDSPTQSLVCNLSPHVHYWHAGASIAYHLLRPDGTYERKVLGPNVLEGEVPQLIVAGRVYKGARIVEHGDCEYTLLGEGVAPGFDYRDFAFVSEEEMRTRANGDDAAVQALLPLIKSDLKSDTTFDSYYD